jgi:hypothetical protein
MAKLAKRSAPVVRRRRHSVALDKAKASITRLRKAARKPPKAEIVGVVATAGAGAALSVAENRGYLKWYWGIPVEVMAGAVGAVVGTMVPSVARGTVGEVVRGASSAMLAVGGYKYGRASQWGAPAAKGSKPEASEGDFSDESSEGDYDDE